MGSKLDNIQPGTVELAALKCLKKSSTYTFNGRNVVTTLVPSFFDGSSSFLKVTRTTINEKGGYSAHISVLCDVINR